MKSIRRARIASQLREEISRIIQFDLKDPRIGFLSVLSVQPTEDLKECKVFVSIMGEETRQRTTLRGLEAARGKIQSLLTQQIRLKETPVLRFIIDESYQKTRDIEEVIRTAREEDEKAALEREERHSPTDQEAEEPTETDQEESS